MCLHRKQSKKHAAEIPMYFRDTQRSTEGRQRGRCHLQVSGNKSHMKAGIQIPHNSLSSSKHQINDQSYITFGHWDQFWMWNVGQMWEWKTQNRTVKHIMGNLFILEQSSAHLDWHFDVECCTTVWLENSEHGSEVYHGDFVYLEQSCAHLNQSFWKLRAGRWSVPWGFCLFGANLCSS